MSTSPRSTVAQVLFPRGATCDLYDVVKTLDRTLAPCLGLGHRLSWHGANVAVLELGATRVTIGLSALPRDGRAHRLCLSVAVGGMTGASTDAAPGRHHAGLARTVVNAVRARHEADTVIWQQVEAAMTPALLMALARAVPAQPDPAWRVGRLRPAPPAAHAVPVTGEQDRIHRARTAVYGEDEAGGTPSIPLRIAATAMASTVAIVALPVGAALMTYSLFRGADMRLSGHVMALTGTFMAVAETQAGQNVLAALRVTGA